jgi:hypothetical protein
MLDVLDRSKGPRIGDGFVEANHRRQQPDHDQACG